MTTTQAQTTQAQTTQAQTARTATAFPAKTFIIACLFVSVWVNLSEVFRYFVIVMPEVRETLSTLPDAAPMSVPVFLVWGVWDTILVVMCVFFWWLYRERFGGGVGSAVMAGTLNWAFFFVLFWLGMVNMNLAEPALAAKALPLAWLEMVVAALIADKVFARCEG